MAIVLLILLTLTLISMLIAFTATVLKHKKNGVEWLARWRNYDLWYARETLSFIQALSLNAAVIFLLLQYFLGAGCTV